MGRFLTKVFIRAYSSIQRLLKPKLFEIETPASAVIGLIEFLSEEFGSEIVEELIMGDGNLNPKYLIFVNGKNIQSGAGLDTPIHDNDVILISAVIDGG